ncbi:hypothetical protein SAMN04487752_0551 [Carnobacterium viridans]|uniref:Uncharacterized protein n=1 Tax=Carnobacterium viridans TaxID=174587 RepID=A0A1H0XX92_9LACT|nr:hypothetical protein SAMN04487752_0551 [Carnobacterium viridans]
MNRRIKKFIVGLIISAIVTKLTSLLMGDDKRKA